MNGLIIRFLQGGGGEAGIPEAGIRISVWFIGMFFLAVGAAMLYLRLKELEVRQNAGRQGEAGKK